MGIRFAVLIAVVGSIVPAFGAFYLATAEVVYALGYLAPYTDPSLDSAEREVTRADAVTTIVKAVDEYLIAAILLLFALGLYGHFIDRIDAVEDSEVAQRLLIIRGLDELIGRITSLVLLVLAIEFFRYALQLQYTSAVDLLYLAVGTLLISGALYLARKRLRGNRETSSSYPLQHRNRALHVANYEAGNAAHQHLLLQREHFRAYSSRVAR